MGRSEALPRLLVLVAAALPGLAAAQNGHNFVFTDDDAPRPTPYANWNEGVNYDDKAAAGAVQGTRFRLRYLLSDGWSGSSSHAIKLQYGDPLTGIWTDVGAQGDGTRVFRHFDSSIVVHAAAAASPAFTSDHRAGATLGLVHEAAIAAWTDQPGTNSYTEEEFVLELAQDCASPTAHHFRFVVDGAAVPQSGMHGGTGNEPRLTCVPAGAPLLRVEAGPANPAARSVGAGATSVPVLQLRLTAGASDGASLRMVKVTAGGTIDDRTEITAARLHVDADGSGTVSTGDTQLASTQTFAANDGAVRFDFNATPQVIPASGSLSLLVTFDLAAGAAPGRTVTAQLASRGHVLAWNSAGNAALMPAGTLPVSGGQVTIAASATRLAFAGAPQTLETSSCSAAFTIQAQDAGGTPSPVSAATQVWLATGSAGGSFFSDSFCGSPAASVTIPAGSDRATFHYRDTVAGTPTLTATASGLSDGTQAQTVNPAAPSVLAITTAPLVLVAGACSSPVVVETRDADQNPSNVTAPTVVSLSSSSAGGAFFSNSGCSSPAPTVTVPAGARSAVFYYSDSAAGTPTVTASAASFTDGTQVETVTPAGATRIAFSTAPVTVAAGACSPAIAVQSQDASGNPAASAAARVVDLTTTSTGGGFFSNSSCSSPTATATIPAGSATATVHYRDTAVGTPTLGAASAGLSPGSQPATIDPGPPARLVFTSAPVTVAAGACSSLLTVALADTFDNPVPSAAARTVTLGSSSPQGAFFGTAACASVVGFVTLAAGATSVSFAYRDDAAGTPTLTASTPGVQAATQDETVVASGASSAAFVTPPPSLAAGACSPELQVETRDPSGNAAPVGAATPVALASDSPGGGFYSDAGCLSPVGSVTIPAGGSSARFRYRDTRAGTATLTATPAGLLAATQAATVSAAPAAQVAFAGPPLAVVAGACSPAQTIEARDPYGNPSNVTSATPVALTSDSAGGTFHAAAGCGAATGSVTIAAGARTATVYYRDTRAGNASLSATAGGLLPGAATATVTAAAPARLVFSTPPQTLNRSICSQVFTVEARDAFDNPSPVAAATTVALSTTAQFGAFHADATCGGNTSSRIIAAGTFAASFFYDDTRIGTETITAASVPLTPATQGVTTIAAGAATSVAFLAPAPAASAGGCSADITIQLQDGAGVPVIAAADLAVTLSSSSGTGVLHAGTGCSAPAASVIIPSGASSTTISYTDPTAGVHTLRATAPGLTEGSVQATVSAGPAVAVGFETPPLALVAGACSPPIDLEVRDASGNATAAPGATTIALATDSPAGSFHADASCGASITSVPIAAGGSAARFHYRDSRAGPSVLTVTPSGGLTGATQQETIGAAAPSTLLFTSAAPSLTAGGCSGSLALEVRDSAGNPRPVAAATPVALASSSTGAAFYSDAACLTPATSVTVAAGATTATLSMRDTLAGAPTVTASATGLSPATLSATVAPAAAAALALATFPPLTTGECSPPISLDAHDAFGNDAPLVSDVTAALATTSPDGAFFADAGCGAQITSVVFPAGTAVAALHYRDTATGAPTLSAAAGGALAPASLSATIRAGPPAHTALRGGPLTVVAGACSGGLELQVHDPYHNQTPALADMAVDLSSSSPGTTFFADAACSSPISSAAIPAGATAATFYFSDTVAGLPAITAAAPGLAITSQEQTITPDVAAALAFTSPPLVLPAGPCSPALTVDARDRFGNTSAPPGGAVITVATSSPVGAFYANAQCSGVVTSVAIPAGLAAATFHYSDLVAGTPTLTADSPGLAGASQAATVVPDLANRLVFRSAPQALQAGACSAAVDVEFQDPFGNPAPPPNPVLVTLSSSSAGALFFSDAGCTAPVTEVLGTPASSTVRFHFSDRVAGSPVLTASAPGLASATQTVTIDAAGAARLAFTTPARILSAGACSPPVGVELRDANDNPTVAAAATTVGLASTSTAGRFFSDPSCQNEIADLALPAGGRTATLHYLDTVAGTAGITASATGLEAGVQTMTVVPGAASVLSIELAAPPVVVAGGCSEFIPFRVRDRYGNRTALTDVTEIELTATSPTARFASNGDCSDSMTMIGMLPGQDLGGFHFTDTAAGTLTLSAFAAGLRAGVQDATVIAGPPVALAFATAPQTVAVDACSAATSVGAADAQGNFATVDADLRVDLGSSSATLTFFADPSCLQPAAGVTLPAGTDPARFYFVDAAAGTPSVRATAAGLGEATQTETILPAGPPAQLAFASPPLELDVGTCSEPIVLQVQDSAGLASRVTADVEVTLETTSPAGGFASDPACATGAPRVTIPAGDYRVLLHYRDDAAGARVLTATAAGLAPGTQDATVRCPAGVDGAPCDDADVCNGREVCQAGACTPGAALTCDDSDPCTVDSCDPVAECGHAAQAGCCQPPSIREEANLVAAVGVPYRYSALGLLGVERGAGPFAWSLCDTPPPDAQLDAVARVLHWTPSSPGPQPLCLLVAGACGEDSYRFTVDVAEAAPPPPVAALVISPESTLVGETVRGDASGSRGEGPLVAIWSWGDGSPPGTGTAVEHRYLRAGTYRVRLQVLDAVGQTAEAESAVRVGDDICTSPSAVRIAADALAGDGSLTATFRCDCELDDAGAVFEWDLGDGTTAGGREVQHTFGPGEHHVRLRVTTAGGCQQSDHVRVRVTRGGAEPPTCEAFVDPATGPAPLRVRFVARFEDVDGGVATARWDFSDGVSMDVLRGEGEVSRTLDRPSRLTAELTVEDSDGLRCRMSAVAEAGSADGVLVPEILTAPTLSATCGSGWRYGEDGRARASGTQPITWSLGKAGTGVGRPEGMTIDPGTGELSWTPPEQDAGKVRVTLRAQNAAGADEQDFLVELACDAEEGCGCGTATGPEAALASLVLAVLLARRRRRTQEYRGSRP